MSFCETCGHRYSTMCSSCATLNGVPVKYEKKKRTNADRIRNMTDEELAEFLEKHCYQYGWLEWLKQGTD